MYPMAASLCFSWIIQARRDTGLPSEFEDCIHTADEALQYYSAFHILVDSRVSQNVEHFIRMIFVKYL